jgi:hypothetical protein
MKEVGSARTHDFIKWAVEFEDKLVQMHKQDIWEYDYISAIDNFTEMKLRGEKVDWDKVFS